MKRGTSALKCKWIFTVCKLKFFRLSRNIKRSWNGLKNCFFPFSLLFFFRGMDLPGNHLWHYSQTDRGTLAHISSMSSTSSHVLVRTPGGPPHRKFGCCFVLSSGHLTILPLLGFGGIVYLGGIPTYYVRVYLQLNVGNYLKYECKNFLIFGTWDH